MYIQLPKYKVGFFLLGLAIWISSCKLHKKKSEVLELQPVTVTNQKISFKGKKDKNFSLIHTQIELKPNFKLRTIEAQAILTLKPYNQTQDSIILDAKRLLINSVRVLGAYHDGQAPYSYNGKQITISVPKDYNPSDTFRLFFDYTVSPYKRDTLYNFMEWSNLGVFFNNPLGNTPAPIQLFAHGETENSSCWFPTLEDPGQKMTQEITLIIPDSFQSFANGVLTASTYLKNGLRKDVWKQSKPHAPYLATFAIGKFHITKSTWNNIPLTYYIEPEKAKLSQEVFGVTPSVLSYFSNKLGYPYPWESLNQVIVRNFLAGGMENTSAIIYYYGMIDKNYPISTEKREEYISHEIAHHWFGDLVTCASWAEVAMNESFATFAEYLWYEHKYGKEAALIHQNKDLGYYLSSSKNKKEPIIQYYYLKNDHLFDAHRYQKGALVLTMLRDELGDSLFFQGIKNYLHDRAFKTTEIQNFKQILEQTSGKELGLFFNQWFLSPGHPVLNIKYNDDTLRNVMEISIAQTQPEPVFRLPVSVAIHWKNDSITSLNYLIKDSLHTIKIPYGDSKPLFIDFDAKKILLAHKIEQKNKEHWINQYQYSTNIISKKEALEALTPLFKEADKTTFPLFMDALSPNKSFLAMSSLYALSGTTHKDIINYFQGTVRKIVIQNPDFIQRANAINILAGWGKYTDVSYQSIYELALKDTVPAVAQRALEALLNFLPDKQRGLKLALCSNFESSDFLPTIQTLSNFYLSEKMIEKLPIIRKYILLNPNRTLFKDYLELLKLADASKINEELPKFLSLPLNLDMLSNYYEYKEAIERLQLHFNQTTPKPIYPLEQKSAWLQQIESKLKEFSY